MFQRASVLQLGSNAGRSKRVAAGGIGQGGSLSAALDHVEHIESGHRSIAKPVALTHGTEERTLFIPTDADRRDPGVQVLLESRMAGHLVALAAFFMQSQPPALAMLDVVAN